MEWYPVYYNGIETNVEVTRCGNVRKIKVDWYGKGKGSYQIKIGQVDFNALSLNNGYKQIKIQIKGLERKSIKLHQLIAAAFLNYKFQGTKLVVDHIDSNKLNNNLNNLRVISHRENVSKEKLIKSGLPTGVYYNKLAKKYQSYIQIDKKRIHLGYFSKIQDASDAYKNKLKDCII